MHEMTPLQRDLSRACSIVGLKIDLDYVAVVDDNVLVRSVARINGLGHINGILIFVRTTDFWALRDAVFDAGYAFSVLSEHREDTPFDLDASVEMFRDWGWSGPVGCTPPLLR